jgi:phospholipid-binding lipoprotein MlaA
MTNAKFPFPAVGTRVVRSAVILAVAALAGCAAPQGPGVINDPYQAQNRKNHEVNVALDSTLIRPASRAYGTVLPGPIRSGVTNFAGNLSLPGYVMNDLLQAKVGDAAQNTLRFAFNTVFGIGGIFDPAGALGLHGKKNDFGATLAVWGVREGAYLEVIALGPTTERDLAGTVVDTIVDPINAILPKAARGYPTGFEVAAALNSRYKYMDTVDSILHSSADGYAQERLIYLEKRHYDLGEPAPSATDPYEDPYAN